MYTENQLAEPEINNLKIVKIGNKNIKTRENRWHIQASIIIFGYSMCSDLISIAQFYSTKVQDFEMI